MDTQQILDSLIALGAKRFDRPQDTLGPDDDFFDVLGIDSFQAMELMTDIEDEFDVEIPDYELQGVKTFAALTLLIEKRL